MSSHRAAVLAWWHRVSGTGPFRTCPVCGATFAKQDGVRTGWHEDACSEKCAVEHRANMAM